MDQNTGICIDNNRVTEYNDRLVRKIDLSANIISTVVSVVTTDNSGLAAATITKLNPRGLYQWSDFHRGQQLSSSIHRGWHH